MRTQKRFSNLSLQRISRTAGRETAGSPCPVEAGKTRELGRQWRCDLQNLPGSHARENSEPESGLDDNQGERCAPENTIPYRGQEPTDGPTASKDL